MATPIKVIVHTISYKGEHIAIFHNPAKGKSECVVAVTGGPRNGATAAHKIVGDWEPIFCIESDVPARHLKNARTNPGIIYNTDEMMARLETLING